MKIFEIYFSPTGTSAKVAHELAKGLSETLCGCETEVCDLTRCEMEVKVGEGDVAVIAAPVYGGHFAPLARKRMEAVTGSGARCVLVAVYGNRAFENAVNDMAAFFSERGFSTVGAAAFVGEHSYSTAETPIAAGRPDEEDMAVAYEFGCRVGEKLNGCCADVSRLVDVPSPEQSLRNFREFVVGYQKMQAESPRKFLPEVDLSRCTACGACVEVCPTAAISDDCHGVDASKCIKCCACVKACPEHARTLYTPFAKPLSENFSARKQPVFVIAD